MIVVLAKSGIEPAMQTVPVDIYKPFIVIIVVQIEFPSCSKLFHAQLNHVS